MKFEVKNTNKSIHDIMRTIGYAPAYFQNAGEFSMVRKVTGNDYPRFHLYVKQNSQDFVFNLHLDQKKPSYGGARAHSGDYDGDAVMKEAQRIQQILKS